jgi:hypothetical protein
MAQDTKRVEVINKFMLELRRLWLRNPDFRFGQVVDSIADGKGELFFIEDKAFLAEIEGYLQAELEAKEKEKSEPTQAEEIIGNTMGFGPAVGIDWGANNGGF